MRRSVGKGDEELSRLFTPRDLAPLLTDMPGRGRVALEAGWMIHALVGVPFLGHLLVLGWETPEADVWWRWTNAVALAAAAVALLRPGAMWQEGRRLAAILLPLGVLVLTSLAVLGPDVRSGAEGPRIGVAPTDVADAKDPSRSWAEVASVVPGTPAAGRLRVGDRIIAINGEPLAPEAPSSDLIARAQTPAIPEGTAVFTIERAEHRLDVELRLPPPPSASVLAGAFRATFVRNVALLLLLGVFLWRDGHGLAAVGLEPGRFWEETRFGLRALLLLMLGHFLLSVLIALVALGVGGDVVEAEVGQRRAVTDALLAERLAWTAGIVLLGSTTEEVVFRGFLLPRLRHATGSWVVAVVLGVVAFGIGHLYEGTLATVQTAGIAVMLSLIFLWRRHLMPCVVAHVGFNTLALVLAYLFLQLGLFDRLNEILGS